jgi:hypothetical protein
MTITDLRQMHQARPFRPFRVHLADGRRLDVLHPEYLSHSPSGRTMVIHKRDDTFEIADLLLVTSIEALNGKGRTGRSGRRTGS